MDIFWRWLFLRDLQWKIPWIYSYTFSNWIEWGDLYLGPIIFLLETLQIPGWPWNPLFFFFFFCFFLSSSCFEEIQAGWIQSGRSYWTADERRKNLSSPNKKKKKKNASKPQHLSWAAFRSQVIISLRFSLSQNIYLHTSKHLNTHENRR